MKKIQHICLHSVIVPPQCFLHTRESLRNQNHIQKYFSKWIMGLEWLESWKNGWKKYRDTVPVTPKSCLCYCSFKTDMLGKIFYVQDMWILQVRRILSFLIEIMLNWYIEKGQTTTRIHWQQEWKLSKNI